jgi:CheY-like chemotaxis protein
MVTMDASLSVVIVDDQAPFRMAARAVLRRTEGFELVGEAASGVEAITVVSEKHPDLVLMDIHMPGESGTDAALEIKQNPETKDIKIAFLSNLKDPWPQTAPARNDLAKSLGMEDFIDKTEDLDLMVSKVREILSRDSKQ